MNLVRFGPGNDQVIAMTEEEWTRFWRGVDEQASYDATADMAEYLAFERIVEHEEARP